MVHSSARVLLKPGLAPLTAALALAAVSAGCGSTPPTAPPPIPQLTITCPPAMEGQSTTGEPVAVTFTAPTTTGGQAPVTLACNPQSGSLFPGGTTTVSCTATDSRNLTATCSLAVFVRVPPRLLGTGRILAFGDSITNGQEGGGSIGPLSLVGSTLAPFAYPNVLEPMLVDRYKLQAPVMIAAGVSGEYAQQGVGRLPNELARYRPDILLLMEGTNDLLFGTAGLEDADVAIRAMVQRAKAENVRVILSTILPQRPDGPRNRGFVAALVPRLNDRIRAIAKTENVPLVEMYDVFIKDMSMIGQDDLHPTPRGFRVMAETFFKAIQEFGERPQPAVTGLHR